MLNGYATGMKDINIYTDGACSGNPGPGGWGAILMYGEYKKELFGRDENTTNNKMELTACIKALEALKEPCNVQLCTDSKYVCDSFNKGWVYKWKDNNWKKSDGKLAKNIDLFESLINLIDIHNVQINWVKGHADNEFNNRCDELARGV